ncbi:hypothetical protein DOTSEDRAFT_35633 [Dothistroma septosporum NZE10]|uniref:Carboxypeptidase n=1 Tax=Dothistroma septosporum (strain NZE10 / CBS 128990) TaxID=675120 RepID=M2YN26_DOTSN|nr:hypothetical protein DOTSEDRAFT_35633 [Dothistroma septosporum NZE10]
MFFLLARLLVTALLSRLCRGQFPAEPEGITLLRSRFDNNVTISYKQTYICETTPDVRGFSGYIHLPPGALADLGGETSYPINTFFWFFEARKDPANAPLSLWLTGGPGSSSCLGLLVENGPCYVNPDSNSTTLNKWSWNNEVNMLYLDQPVQVGFSYDTLTNVTNNLILDEITILNATDPVPEQNATFLVGTYASQDSNQTALGSVNAAIAAWHFLQTWVQEFPAYMPNDNRISLATESYGGRYGPAFFAFFQEQNDKIRNQSCNDDGQSVILHLDTLMLINSCIDRLVQWPSYPHIAYNNTYGIETVNASIHEQMLDALYREGGCNDQIYQCRNASLAFDPKNIGVNKTVNKICQEAETFCSKGLRSPFWNFSGRNYYDFATLEPDPFTPKFYQGYLDQPHVHAALGVPLNFSQSSGAVREAFRISGDYNRPGWLEDLAYLLESGVKVAMAYGDRDYACNWIGGEAVSLAINYTNTTNFHAAGYTAIQTNDTYSGGQVRQYGNLSFSRVFQAGHEVPAYQPETSYKIFMRALNNVDIATGLANVTSEQGIYSSVGTADTWAIKNEQPKQPLQFCYVLEPSTCTEGQIDDILNGTAVIRNYIVVDDNSTALFPDIVGSNM